MTRSRTLLTLRQLGTRARISPQRVKVLHAIGVTPRPDARDGEGRPLYTPSTAEAWISAARRGNGQHPSWWLRAPNRPLTTLAALVLPVAVRQHARECLVTVWGAGESDPLAVVVYHDRLLPTWAIEDELTALEAEVAARYPGYRADAAVWASVTVEEWSAQDATRREMTPRTPSGAPIICGYTRTAAPAPRVRRLLAKAPDDVQTSPITSGELSDVLGRPVPLWPLDAFEPARAAEALQRGALPYQAEYDPQRIRSMAEALELLEHERSHAEKEGWRACLTRLAEHLAEQIEGRRRSYPPFPVTPRLNAGYDRPDDDLTSAVILTFPKLTPRQDELVSAHTSTRARTKDAFDQHRRDLDALRTARIALNDAWLTGSDDVHAAVEFAYGRLALAVGNFYPHVRGSDHRPCMTRVLRGEPAPGSLLARYLATVRWHEPGPDGPEPHRAQAWHALSDGAGPRTIDLSGIDTAGNLLARTTQPDGTKEIIIQWPIGHWSDTATAPDEASFIGARHNGAGWLFIQHPDGPLAPLPLAPGSASANFAWGPGHRNSPAAASIAFAVDNWLCPEPQSLSAWLDDQLAKADHDRYFALSVREVREHYAVTDGH